MALLLELRPEKEDQLRNEATRKGTTMEAYAKLLVEESLPIISGHLPSDGDDEVLLDELAALGKSLRPAFHTETYSREMIYADHN